MGTHARIGIIYSEEDCGFLRCNSVYCSWDGYPYGVGGGVGLKLLMHYNTTNIVEELINRGRISSLGETIKQTEFRGRFIIQNGDVYHGDLLEIPNYTHFRADFDEIFREEWNYIWNPKVMAWFVKGPWYPKWVMMTKSNIQNLEERYGPDFSKIPNNIPICKDCGYTKIPNAILVPRPIMSDRPCNMSCEIASRLIGG